MVLVRFALRLPRRRCAVLCVLSCHTILQDLKRVSTELGEAMSDADIQEIIDEATTSHQLRISSSPKMPQADRDGDGAINEDEFLRVMSKQGLC